MRKGKNICSYPQVKTNGPCGKSCVGLYCKDHIKCYRKNTPWPVVCGACGLYCNSKTGRCIQCKKAKKKIIKQQFILCDECHRHHLEKSDLHSPLLLGDILEDDILKEHGLCSKTPLYSTSPYDNERL